MKPRPKGREFEELVSRLEQALSAKNVIIKSPDHIPDLTSRSLREVDISIRGKIGVNDILIIIECRNRSRPADIAWIEQLNSKKNNIGANKVIAVSKEGFTKEAEIKAEQYGIETRLVISRIIDSMNNSPGSMVVLVPSSNYRVSKIYFYDQHDVEIQVPQGTQALIDGSDVNSSFIENARIGKRMSLQQLADEVISDSGIARNAALENSLSERSYNAICEPGTMIVCNQNSTPVSRFTLKLRIHKFLKSHKSRVISQEEYRSKNEILAVRTTDEAEVPDLGLKLGITYITPTKK